MLPRQGGDNPPCLRQSGKENMFPQNRVSCSDCGMPQFIPVHSPRVVPAAVTPRSQQTGLLVSNTYCPWLDPDNPDTCVPPGEINERQGRVKRHRTANSGAVRMAVKDEGDFADRQKEGGVP